MESAVTESEKRRVKNIQAEFIYDPKKMNGLMDYIYKNLTK